MTDIATATWSYQVEKRSWLLSEHGTEPGTTPTVTLDVSAFTAGTHYPNGYFPSGLYISQLGSGLWGPGNNALTAMHGLLFSSVKVPDPAVTTRDVGGAVLIHGFVLSSKLPIAVVAGDIAKMPLIHFTTVAP